MSDTALSPASTRATHGGPGGLKFSEIGFCWALGTHSGWGTYALNFAVQCTQKGLKPAVFWLDSELVLTEAQAALLDPALKEFPKWAALLQQGSASLDFPFLHGLGDNLEFLYPTSGIKGHPDVGVIFFESSTIPAANIARADRFNVIVAGSTWNTDVLKRHGFSRTVFCPQGVDLSMFAPRPRQNAFGDRFVIFSGGKLEYRKGQDIVVAAFKRFHQRHPEALLITAWNSPWPKMAESIALSPNVTGFPGLDAAGSLDVPSWLVANGLPETSFVSLRALPNAVVPDLLKEVDLALFPNRCEGGTNLVAMECMAMGVPVVLSRNTGHTDLISGTSCYTLDSQASVGERLGKAEWNDWGESSVDELVEKMEQAFTDRIGATSRGMAGRAFMQGWDWSTQIDKFLKIVDGVA